MTSVSEIKSIVDQMNTTSVDYDENALKIWSMLSEEEKSSLTSIINIRPPLYVSYVIEDKVLKKLHDAKLATLSSYNDEYGYLRPTFVGYAAFKQGTPRSPYITLPGEKKS